MAVSPALLPLDEAAPPVAEDAAWSRVGEMVDRASRDDDLELHNLHLVAAARRRAGAKPVTPSLARAERLAALRTLAAPVVAGTVRAIVEGPLVLFKGPEAAALYPDPALRPFRDLDFLVPDAETAQAALVDSGFEPVGDPALYVGIHHLRPLAVPGSPLVVEVHQSPKWPEGFEPPSTEAIAERAVPSAVGVPGVLAPSAADHALILAAHAWAHSPLDRFGHLLDVALLVRQVDGAAIERRAREWGIERLWRTTADVAGALLGEGRRCPELRVWARHLPALRERTVLESHLASWLAPFSVLPAGRAARETVRALAREVRPAAGERPAAKARRSARALTHPLTRLSDHERALGDLIPITHRKRGSQ